MPVRANLAVIGLLPGEGSHDVARKLTDGDGVLPRVSAAPPRPPARAYLVWGIGLLAYALAVFQRSSLGVAAVDAQHRFSAGASAISLFVVLQLAVYAAMQIPVGVVLDRVGSRTMIVVGGLTMAAGQLVLAVATDVPTAIAARVLVGAGDAMTFISVLRVIGLWFPGRTVPLLTQLTGLLGQLGQIAAAFPLVRLLHTTSWTTTFLVAAVAGVLVTGLSVAALRDAPVGLPPLPRVPLARIRADLGATWREPGTRLGLFTHLVTQFSGTVFALLWGYPFLVQGEGRSPATAAGLLTLQVLVGMAMGPLFGRFCGSWPLRRSSLVFAVVGATAGLWTVVLLWPGRAPVWLLVALVVVLGTNGPGSMIAFDYARTENPVERMGSASGVVNVGGFVASLLTVLLVGAVLDALTPGGSAAYGLPAFRVAFAVQYVFWVVGLVGVAVNRRRVRARLAGDGVVIAPLHRAVGARLRGGSVYT